MGNGGENIGDGVREGKSGCGGVRWGKLDTLCGMLGRWTHFARDGIIFGKTK